MITNKQLWVAAFFCFVVLSPLKAGWYIVGSALPEGVDRIVMTQVEGSTTEFEWRGKLDCANFMVTDGSISYGALCGDIDPLYDPINLEADGDSLRIRYLKNQDYLNLRLTVNGSQAVNIRAELHNIAHSLFLMGGPFNNSTGSWDIEGRAPMQHDALTPHIFRYKGNIRYNDIGDGGGELKLMVEQGWDDNYHPATSNNQNIRLLEALKKPMPIRQGRSHGDLKWLLASDHSDDGYYELTVDLANMTLTVDSFKHKDLTELPLVMYVTGSATPNGWTNTNTMRMRQVEDGVYEWEGMISAGEFKFQMKRGTYQYAYMALENGTKVYSGQEYGVSYCKDYSSGQCADSKFVTTAEGMGKIGLDLNRKVAWVEGQPMAPTKVESPEGVEVTCYSHDGKLYLSVDVQHLMQVRFFGVDGRLVTERDFVHTTEVQLPAGCYIIAVDDSMGVPVARLRTCVK